MPNQLTRARRRSQSLAEPPTSPFMKREHRGAQSRDPDAWRTRLCGEFEQYGNCSRGDACTYAHGENELRHRGSELWPMAAPQVSPDSLAWPPPPEQPRTPERTVSPSWEHVPLTHRATSAPMPMPRASIRGNYVSPSSEWRTRGGGQRARALHLWRRRSRRRSASRRRYTAVPLASMAHGLPQTPQHAARALRSPQPRRNGLCAWPPRHADGPRAAVSRRCKRRPTRSITSGRMGGWGTVSISRGRARRACGGGGRTSLY